MKIILTLIVLVCAGCISTPDMDTGEGCWRYGVAEDNTGRMSLTDPSEIPVVRMKYKDLLAACGLESPETSWSNRRALIVRACYDPESDTIYEYILNLGDYYKNHELCHVVLGREHNNCTGYGIGSDSSACDWSL